MASRKQKARKQLRKQSIRKKPKLRIVAFNQLPQGALFRKCYDFESVPSVTLRFQKLSSNAALRVQPAVFAGRSIYFGATQPVLREKEGA